MNNSSKQEEKYSKDVNSQSQGSRKPRPNFIDLQGSAFHSNKSAIEKTANEATKYNKTIGTEKTSKDSTSIVQKPELNDVVLRRRRPSLNSNRNARITEIEDDEAKENPRKSENSEMTRAPSENIPHRIRASSTGDQPTILAKLYSKFLSPDGKLSSPCDSVCSLDSIPWNIDGTETIVENPAKRSKMSNPSNMEKKRLSFIERELETIKEENKQLKASLEEAGRLNAQWRTYHQERQGYVEKLLSTIHTLQQRQLSPPNMQTVKGTGSKFNEDIRHLKETLSRSQAEHQEHISLLQMQVRAHQDDWEAERAEKKMERTGRQEAEERAALLFQEVEHLQQRLLQMEQRRNICDKCNAHLRPFDVRLPPQPPSQSEHDINNSSDVQKEHVPIMYPNYNNNNTENAHSLANQFLPFRRQGSQNFYRSYQRNSPQPLYFDDRGGYTTKIASVPNSRNNLKLSNVPTNAVKQRSLSRGYSKNQRDNLRMASCDSRTAEQKRYLPEISKSQNVPLKGWIPVSMMDHSQAHNPENQKSTGFTEQVNPMQGSNRSSSILPSTSSSRESSLLSCDSSFAENYLHHQSFNDSSDERISRKSNYEAVNYHSTNGPILRNQNHGGDNKIEARHRARNILTHAIPSSPISSGPSTPAGGVSKTYDMNYKSIQDVSNHEFAAKDKAFLKHQTESKRNDDIIKVRNDLKNISADGECVEESMKESKNRNNKSETQSEQSNLSKSKDTTQSPMQVSSSTSNETSRSSSPGMSLTTFSMNSDGKGIPGAIYFSLHSDVQPCLNGEVLTSVECKSPKSEITISRMQIEPKSPRPSRSPMEISTKEHWMPVAKSQSIQTSKTDTKISSEVKVARNHLDHDMNSCYSSDSNHSFQTVVEKTSKSSSSASNIPLNSSDTKSIPEGKSTNRRSIASKNIASAIISYEIAAKGEKIIYSDRVHPSSKKKSSRLNNPNSHEIVATVTSKEITCPTCQLLFKKENHLKFLDHFEHCKGPEFADM